MKSRGFALIEIVVATLIVLVLGALILGTLQKTRARALSSQCQSNLRQIGRAMHLYAVEHNGEIGLLGYYGYANSSVTWLNFLTGSVGSNYRKISRNSGKIYLEDASMSLCPGEEPYLNPLPEQTTTHGYIYGALYRQADDPSALNISRDPNNPEDSPAAMTKVVSMSRMEQPSNHLFLADSYALSSLNRSHSQIYLIDPNSSGRGVHLRHNGRANGLFADGHVEAMEGERMKNLPYTRVRAGFTDGGIRIQF